MGGWVHAAHAPALFMTGCMAGVMGLGGRHVGWVYSWKERVAINSKKKQTCLSRGIAHRVLVVVQASLWFQVGQFASN